MRNRVSRWIVAGLLASALGGALIVTHPTPHWSPICAIFEEGSLEWWAFGCWYGKPPDNPQA